MESEVITLANIDIQQTYLDEAVVAKYIDNGIDRPVLVIDFGSYYFILDGHHRVEAAKRIAGEDGVMPYQCELDAYVLDGDEVNQVVEDKFYGDFPSRHQDLVEAMGLDYEF